MLKHSLLEQYNFPARALRNLGTFNTHFMDEPARDIFFHYTAINAVDNHAYPELEFIKAQCAQFLLTLFHAPNEKDFRYFTTSGSSESVLLAMLVLKKQHQRFNPHRLFKPNIIIGENSHVAWYKAARYLEIELRIAKVNNTLLTIDNEQILTLIDADTIGVCCTLGAPTTLLSDDVFDLNTKLEHHHHTMGQFIPIHVDAASGGFVFPFVNPELKFDFELNHVVSINVSSHKYGFIYPSLGWLFIRYHSCLDELLDESDYLGASIKRFSMQFSHSAAHLMTQYYYIQALGEIGYKKIMVSLFAYAEQLKQRLIDTQKNIQFIDAMTSCRQAARSCEQTASLPGLIFTIDNIKMNTLSEKLKEKNWYLPVYSLPGQTEKLQVARVVIRYGYNETLIDHFSSDMLTVQD